MTKEELKQHCEKQVKACEMWAENRGQEPSGKVYEEHKLVLDLINELQDKYYELWEESYEVEHARNIQLEEKIKALEQQPCDDCENNDGECCRLLFEKSFNKDCVSRQKCKEGMLKYGFHAPDMTVTEFIEDELMSVTPTQGWIPVSERLPKVGEKVLCQCQANIFEVLKLMVDGWYHDENHCYMSGFVIAWQPLPKPYEEKRGSEE